MAIVDITAENDADFIRGFVYQTLNADGSPGAPVDLTGNKLRMGVRVHAADIEEDLLLTTENGGLTITDPVNGMFTLWITNEQPRSRSLSACSSRLGIRPLWSLRPP